MFGRLVLIPTDVLDPPPKVCYNCWQGGQPLLKCPRPAMRCFCHNCGRSGVAVYSCPRCSQENYRYKEEQSRLKRDASTSRSSSRQDAGRKRETTAHLRERGNTEREERSAREAAPLAEPRLRRPLTPEPRQPEPAERSLVRRVPTPPRGAEIALRGEPLAVRAPAVDPLLQNLSVGEALRLVQSLQSLLAASRRRSRADDLQAINSNKEWKEGRRNKERRVRRCGGRLGMNTRGVFCPRGESCDVVA